MPRALAPPVAPPSKPRAIKGPQGVPRQRHLLRVVPDAASRIAAEPGGADRPFPVQVRRVDLAGEVPAAPAEVVATTFPEPDVVGGPV